MVTYGKVPDGLVFQASTEGLSPTRIEGHSRTAASGGHLPRVILVAERHGLDPIERKPC